MLVYAPKGYIGFKYLKKGYIYKLERCLKSSGLNISTIMKIQLFSESSINAKSKLKLFKSFSQLLND